MPPRISPRRLFVCVVVSGSLVLLLVNVSLTWPALWHQETGGPPLGSSSGAGPSLAQQHDDNKMPPPPPQTRAQANLLQMQDDDKEKKETRRGEVGEKIVEKKWFMKGGTLRPTPALSQPPLFPNEAPLDDRVAEQLMYIPPGYDPDTAPIKKILLYNGLATWAPAHAGTRTFIQSKCPVDRCSLTANRDEAGDADAILYKDQFQPPSTNRPLQQIWILYFLECPYHTGHMKYSDVFNWTATYRRDSDIVAPYERWTYYDNDVRQKIQERNYAANKTRKVAWFVSNCGARNERLAYARELQKYIPVDIYGSCGPLRCSRNNKHCFELLNSDYKFYLAFENSNCRDYITEKFYVNGLGQNVLPIVMGARPEDYERSAPYRSYIHVDEFQSPKELAQYLRRLDKNDELYNSYFRWKGTGEFINTFFWCRLCAMLHGASVPGTSPRWYEDVNEWWRGNGVCNSGSWRKKQH